MPNFFGDSITATQSSQDQPGRIYYPYWMSFLRGDPMPTVLAKAADGAADQAAPAYNSTKDDSFILIGTNDRQTYRVAGVTDANGVALFKNIVTAVSYWITGDMVPVQHAGWSFTGTWTNYVGTHPWPAMGKYSNVSGSIASATFDDDVLLLGYTMADGGGMGSATVKVDGVTVGTISCTPPRTILLSAGHSAYAPGVFRATGFGLGAHTVTVTTTSTSYVMIDWVGGLSSASLRMLRLLTMPYTVHGDSAEVNTYNGVFTQVAAQCLADGFDVGVIDTGSVVRLTEMCGNVAPNNDYHPDNHGHMSIALKMLAET